MCGGHWTHGAIERWPPPPMICGPLHTWTRWAAEEGGEDAWRPTRGAFLKKKWFSNIYFDNKMFFLLKILL